MPCSAAELRALQGLSQQLQRIAIGGRLTGRVDVATDHPDLGALGTAINHLLARASAPPATPNGNGSHGLFSDVGDRVHEVVLIHGDSILYANPQFSNLLGVDRKDIIGRKLQDLVPPDHAELVADNLRKRLAGEPAQERYEVDLVGLQGQLSRLEIATAATTYDGAPALLITGVEVIPTQTVPALNLFGGDPVRSRARTALESLAEAVLTTDLQGRVDYANPAAARLLGMEVRDLQGKLLDDVVSLVDETDRKLLADPVQQAISSGTSVRLGRRALLLSRSERHRTFDRAVRLTAAQPRQWRGGNHRHRGAAARRDGAARHHAADVLPGDARCAHRAHQPARVRAPPGRGAWKPRIAASPTHVLCFLDLDHFKAVNDSSGHLAGDSLLREVAKLDARRRARFGQRRSRVGGDEFARAAASGCPLEAARQIADDLARNDRRAPLRVEGPHVHTSAPASAWSSSRATAARVDETLAAADSACYVAKKQGSGHVAVYSARDEVAARQSGEIHWLQHAADRDPRDNQFPALLAAHHAGLRRQRPRAGDGSAGATEGRQPVRTVAPIDLVHAAERYRLMGLVDRWVVTDHADRAGPRRDRADRRAQPRHERLGPDARGSAVPRVRGGVPRPQRRGTRAGVLRDLGERGGGEPGPRAAFRRRAARHGLPVRAR